MVKKQKEAKKKMVVGVPLFYTRSVQFFLKIATAAVNASLFQSRVKFARLEETTLYK